MTWKLAWRQKEDRIEVKELNEGRTGRESPKTERIKGNGS